MFVAQVSSCYPDIVKKFPQQLIDILQTHAAVLFPEVRMTICRSLILLKKRKMITAIDLYQLFFGLFRCQDKQLREFLSTYIITDIRNSNKKHKNNVLNKTMQNHMYSLMSDGNKTVVTVSLKVIVELYQRKVWNEPKTANVISTACFSKYPNVMTIAMKFFLGDDRATKDDSEAEEDCMTARELLVKYHSNKKNSRKKVLFKKQLKKIRRDKKMKNRPKDKTSNNSAQFSAIHYLNDPDGFADRLYQKLQKSTCTFEVRLLMIELLGRVIGIHQLFMFNFYPFLQRFLQPYQRDVTKILTALAQASHQLVPPEILRDTIRTLANNFVSERNSSEAMAVGINTIREVCARCPLAMTEELLRDLTQFQRKQPTSVCTASRSLVMLFRKHNPQMLHRRDRGRFTEATKEIVHTSYGEVVSRDYVVGSEILPDVTADMENMDESNDGWEVCSDESDSDSDGDWIDVSSDEELNAKIAAETKKRRKAQGKEEEVQEEEEQEMEVETKEIKLTDEEKLQKSKELSQTKIFTPADFELINAHQEKKETTLASRKTSKRQKLVKFSEETNTEGGEIIPLAKIEDITMKKRRDKEAQMAALLESKSERRKRKYGDRKINPNSSSTNKVKLKQKPFMMVRPKMLKKKTGRSFQQKQKALKQELLKRRKKYKFR